jgi:TonB-linked SusC/RagA family outer membrane protein
MGATVIVKGQPSIGTMTDIDGNFSLETSFGNLLQISYVGMIPKEVLVDDQHMTIFLSSGMQLDEVVITALGISREKKALGFAATTISGADIAVTQRINPMTALQGKVAGLEVSSSPGSGTTQNVIIRGASTFGKNQPLYIVDGVPLTNEQNRSGDNLNNQIDFGSGINALNPDDIEMMTVLKGAAATALYGSRAANGVVMIKTKSGANTSNKIQLEYDGGLTLTRVGYLPKEQKQFGQGWSGDRALDENGNWGPAFDGQDRVWGNIIDNSQQIKPYRYLENRIRDFYTTGVGYKNSLSLLGGNEQTNYFFSFSQNRLDGPIPTANDSYDRYTLSTRGQHRAGRLTISSSVNFSTEKNKTIGSGQGASLFRSLQEIPTELSIIDMKDYKAKFYDLDTYFTPYGLNPYFVLNENGATQNKQKLFGKAELNFDLTEGLVLTYRFGGDYETSRAEIHESIVSFSEDSPNAASGPTNAGNYEERRRERIQMNHDLFATFNRRISNAFSINAIVGYNVNDQSYTWLMGKVNSIDIPGYYNLINSLSPPVSEQYAEQHRIVGAYANADLGYGDFAYLTLTARNDWSSTLPVDKRSYFYPGATFSFLLTDFMQQREMNTGVLDFAKFRLAYGMTGNDYDPYYIYNRYVAGLSMNPGYPSIDDLTFPLGGVNSYTLSDRLGNENLRPELTREFEVGAEVRLLNQRVGLDVSFYDKFTKDLIEVLPRDPSSGFFSMVSNLGDVRNRGVELTLHLTPVVIRDFSWDLDWNYTVNKNKLERLDVDEVYLSGYSGAGIYAVEGKPIGQFKVYTARKVELEGKEYTVVDGAGIPMQTTDPAYLGKDINEKYRMGLSSTFRWRGLALGATLDFRYGGYLYSYTKDYMHWPGSAPETVLNDRYPFMVPNSVVQNADGSYSENTNPVDPTALHTFYSDGGFEGPSFAVIDRSYLKLRDVSLSYQFSKRVCEKLHLRGLRLAANASNFLLWKPVENQYIDPETTTFGNDIYAKFGEYGANPTNSTYTFSMNISF